MGNRIGIQSNTKENLSTTLIGGNKKPAKHLATDSPKNTEYPMGVTNYPLQTHHHTLFTSETLNEATALEGFRTCFNKEHEGITFHENPCWLTPVVIRIDRALKSFYRSEIYCEIDDQILANTIFVLLVCKRNRCQEDIIWKSRWGSIWKSNATKKFAKSSVKLMEIIASYNIGNEHIFVREIDHDAQREEIEEYIRLQTGKSVPLLFVNGRCIGGEKEVAELHESGQLKPLFSFVGAFMDDKTEF